MDLQVARSSGGEVDVDALIWVRYRRWSGWSAVPMTYLIDRDGKVMDAWYGFDRKKAEEAFHKLELAE